MHDIIEKQIAEKKKTGNDDTIDDMFSRQIYRVSTRRNITSLKIEQSNDPEQHQKNEESKTFKEYIMIRTKQVNYLDKPCIAVYFKSVTTHVEQIRLEGQV